jgi:hypothetical protein
MLEAFQIPLSGVKQIYSARTRARAAILSIRCRADGVQCLLVRVGGRGVSARRALDLTLWGSVVYVALAWAMVML